jgi:UDP-GlcNAc:undecaprenyl-phosphate/decaprenyl-phosphate GlcNAc-1-phosphate transferase
MQAPEGIEVRLMTPLIELLGVAGTSFALSLLFTPLVRYLAPRWRLVDCPDGHRKLHGRAMPVAGGLAVLLATTITVTLLLYFAPISWIVDHPQPRLLLSLLLASVAICLVGVVDDYGYLRGRQKLCGQIFAVAIVITFGIRVQYIHLFGWEIELGAMALPFTAFLLLGAINSLNLLDGMDGFLSSVGIVICIGIAMVAALGQHWMASAIALALMGSMLGFLRYNFPPASIFLGDSGSMLIGLVIGVLAIQSSLKGPATVGFAAPLALLTIPIFDTTAAIVRRKLTGRSLYATDRGHLHHCLQRKGLSSRLTIFLVVLLCLVTVMGAIASMLYDNDYMALLAALFVVSTLILTRLFGHAEVGLVRKRLAATFLSLLTPRSRQQVREVEIRLQGSVDWKEIWNELTTRAEQLRLRSVRLDVNAPRIGEGYHAFWELWRGSEEDALWRTEIPLVAHARIVGRVLVTGERDDLCVSEKVALVAQMVHEIEATVLTIGGRDSDADTTKQYPTSIQMDSLSGKSIAVVAAKKKVLVTTARRHSTSETPVP